MIFLVFYILLYTSTSNTRFELLTKSGNLKNSMSLIGILRTPVTLDNREINIAEFMALPNLDKDKKEFLEKTLLQIMDDSFGTHNCVIICINGEKLQGSGCSNLQTYLCPYDMYDSIVIPSYDKQPIKVSLETNAEFLNSNMPMT